MGLQIHKLECGNIARVTCRTLSQTVFPKTALGAPAELLVGMAFKQGCRERSFQFARNQGLQMAGQMRCRGCFCRPFRRQDRIRQFRYAAVGVTPDPSGTRVYRWQLSCAASSVFPTRREPGSETAVQPRRREWFSRPSENRVC